MPWRRKPARYLRYWTGPVKRDSGHKTILIYGMGPAPPTIGRCHHVGRLNIADLPDWNWYDISAHLGSEFPLVLWTIFVRGSFLGGQILATQRSAVRSDGWTHALIGAR